MKFLYFLCLNLIVTPLFSKEDFQARFENLERKYNAKQLLRNEFIPLRTSCRLLTKDKNVSPLNWKSEKLLDSYETAKTFEVFSIFSHNGLIQSISRIQKPYNKDSYRGYKTKEVTDPNTGKKRKERDLLDYITFPIQGKDGKVYQVQLENPQKKQSDRMNKIKEAAKKIWPDFDEENLTPQQQKWSYNYYVESYLHAFDHNFFVLDKTSGEDAEYASDIFYNGYVKAKITLNGKNIFERKTKTTHTYVRCSTRSTRKMVDEFQLLFEKATKNGYKPTKNVIVYKYPLERVK